MVGEIVLMQRLPGIQIGERVYHLPCAARAATALAQAMIEPGPDARAWLGEAMAHDESLALWAECHARRHAIATDDLPAWIAERAVDLLSSEPLAMTNDGELASRLAALEVREPPDREGISLVALARRLRRQLAIEADFEAALEREKLESLAEFAAGAGHEINNPLAVISGRAQLLLAGEKHPDRRRDLATIHAQARRVHEMILDLMLFARPPLPELATIDLRRVVELAAIETGRQQAPGTAELNTDLPRTPVLARADEGQLVVALRTLVDNALEFAPDGAIDISLSAGLSSGGAPEALLAVRDHGEGIAPETRRHLFDPFYSGRSAGRGLGMGLAKCWRIVVGLHGGTLEVTSEPGQGAIFTIRLPALAAAADTAPPAPHFATRPGAPSRYSAD